MTNSYFDIRTKEFDFMKYWDMLIECFFNIGMNQ